MQLTLLDVSGICFATTFSLNSVRVIKIDRPIDWLAWVHDSVVCMHAVNEPALIFGARCTLVNLHTHTKRQRKHFLLHNLCPYLRQILTDFCLSIWSTRKRYFVFSFFFSWSRVSGIKLPYVGQLCHPPVLSYFLFTFLTVWFIK